MENKSTKQLIAAANRKCEMRWKVLAFNPDEDNKLVKEFKDFDCIDCAVAKKREYLEKNPTHVVEILSESKAQRNEDKEFTIKLVTPFGKAKVCSWKAASMNDAVKEFLDANPAYRENKKGAVIAESAQRNEGNFKDDATSLKDAQIKLDRAKDELKEAIAQKDFNRQQRFKSDIKYYEDLIKYIKANPVKESSQKNETYTIQNVKTREDAEKIIKEKCKPKDFHFTDAGIAYDGKKNIAQYTPHSNQLVIFESAQKNEGFYKYIDDVPTEEIAKALKELGIKEPYATQKAKIADKLAKHFGLRRVPTPIEMVPVLNALPYFKDESSQKNEALDEHELKAWLKSEHSRALKNIKNMAANDSSSFFKGYATALHEIQRKFGL